MKLHAVLQAAKLLSLRWKHAAQWRIKDFQGTPMYYLEHVFPENYMKWKKIGPRGDVREACPLSVDPMNPINCPYSLCTLTFIRSCWSFLLAQTRTRR